MLFLIFNQFAFAQEETEARANIKLTSKENLRVLTNNVLYVLKVLPANTVISFEKNSAPVNYDYQSSDGSISRSSNGFLPNIQIESFPADSGISEQERQVINQREGGLYISSTVRPFSTGEWIQPIKPSLPQNDFLLTFTKEGKPLQSFKKYLIPRFKENLNKIVDWNQIPHDEQVKWTKVFDELAKVGTRLQPTESKWFFTTIDEAHFFSERYDNERVVAPHGAWTVAVKSTSVRHGFPNVPCSEFMSEVLRQAYERAGYDVKIDFNKENSNELIWSQTAAVVNLSLAMTKAGWIPWEANLYAPVTGAIMMHEAAQTPGHAYLNAGDEGRIIMDNGNPLGRDLRVTSDKILKLMYNTGVFFLPPGMIPKKWDELLLTRNP